MLTTSGDYIDGSWTLTVQINRDNKNVLKLAVKSDTHIGGVMHKIVESKEEKRDWSDYALWWPKPKLWLLHTRTTLDQYGVHSDDILHFIPRSYEIKLLLPSLQQMTLTVNFATSVFSLVCRICREFGIRYPEEMSIKKPINKLNLKENFIPPLIKRDLSSTIHQPPATKDDDDSLVKGITVIPLYTNSTTLRGGGGYDTLRTPQTTLMRGGGGGGGGGATLMSYNTLPSRTLLNGSSPSILLQPAKSQSSFDFELCYAQTLANSLHQPLQEAINSQYVIKTKNLLQKSRLNATWLDTSRSLMEQDIDYATIPTLQLAFKFYTYYDLNENYDAVRINQLYEQARWSLLTELIDCTEDEAILFAALQIQIKLQSEEEQLPNNSFYYSNTPTMKLPLKEKLNGSTFLSPTTPTTATMPTTPKMDSLLPTADDTTTAIDEVDNLLNNLEKNCLGIKNEVIAPETKEIPSIKGYLKIHKEGKLGIKHYQKYFCILCECQLTLYKDDKLNVDDLQQNNNIIEVWNLKSCEVSPDVHISTKRFVIRLRLSSNNQQLLSNQQLSQSPSAPSTPLSQLQQHQQHPLQQQQQQQNAFTVLLRCENQSQYINFLAALNLAKNGKTLASTTAYEREREDISETIRLQTPGPQPKLSIEQQNQLVKNLLDYIPERVLRKTKSKESLKLRITDAHANVRELDLISAKLKYLQYWQRLTNYGYTHFLVQFHGQKKPELIAILPNRLVTINKDNGQIGKTWHFKDLRSWNINWNSEKIILEFSQEELTFQPLTANCKTIVEFIGGYIFLSQRTPDKNQELNVKLYHRLTCAST